MNFRRILNFILVIVLLLFICENSLAIKMNIDPPRIKLTVTPGDKESGYISVWNYDEEDPMHIKAYVSDLVYLPDGSNDFLPPGKTPWSCADWIKIGPTEFDIGPGEEARVRYVISVPEDATGGRYGVIFFEMSPRLATLEGGATAGLNIRLGSIVLVEVKGTQTYIAALRDIKVGKYDKKKGTLTIGLNVYNASNILIRPHGTITIIDSNKNEISTFNVNEGKTGVFPQTSRTFYADYQGIQLPKGEYFLQVVLDYGGDAYLGGQKRFEIK